MKKIKKGILFITLASLVTTFSMSMRPVNAIDYLGIAQSVAWQIAKKASSAFFNRKPTIKKGPNYITSGTGSLKFNTDIGASVKVNINLGKSRLEVDSFAQTDFLNWLDKIAVTLTAPNNGKDVINRSVTHNQHSYYKSASPYGIYNLRFTDTDKCKWDCYYTLVDYAKSASRSVDMYQNIYNTEGLEINSVYNASNQKSYILPTKDLSSKPFSLSKESISLSAGELNNQFYDENRKVFVNALRDYDVDDKILFSDIISDIQYNKEDNYTLFSFDTDDSTIHWPFAGDLTTQYKKGDTLKLKLKVVEEYRYDNNVFENLDYCLNGMKLQEKNEYPNINDYLK